MKGLFAFMFVVGGLAALTAFPGLLPAYLLGLVVVWIVTPTNNRRNAGGKRAIGKAG